MWFPYPYVGKAPVWYKGLQYKKLAPKYSFFIIYKETKDAKYYTECFYKEVLDKLNPINVINDLYHLSKGKDIALICYEKPPEFCHRHLVASWLIKNGYDCNEWERIGEKIMNTNFQYRSVDSIKRY